MSAGGEDSDRREIIVVGLNGALQRTIVFQPPKGLKVGNVNRASSVGAGIGGKGQNVCVALAMLAEGDKGEAIDNAGLQVTLAHFAGGRSGEILHNCWACQAFQSVALLSVRHILKFQIVQTFSYCCIFFLSTRPRCLNLVPSRLAK